MGLEKCKTCFWDDVSADNWKTFEGKREIDKEQQIQIITELYQSVRINITHDSFIQVNEKSEVRFMRRKKCDQLEMKKRGEVFIRLAAGACLRVRTKSIAIRIQDKKQSIEVNLSNSKLTVLAGMIHVEEPKDLKGRTFIRKGGQISFLPRNKFRYAQVPRGKLERAAAWKTKFRNKNWKQRKPRS